ncbi:MAG: LapA family protein [Candidatus Omnitrophota bacterium]
MLKDEQSLHRYKLIAICSALLLFGIFLGMNSTPTPVWIFGWKPQLPLIIIALICFLLGCVCGWFLCIINRRKAEEE